MADTLTATDRQDIADILSRYAWALDTGDVELFVTCFASDGELVWDVFEEALSWKGGAALRHFATFLRDQPATAGRQHHVANLLVEPMDGGAKGRSYASVHLRQGEGPHLLNVMGWYEDEFRREDGRWVIASRIIRDWSGPVLGRLAGQDGQRVARPLPPPLAGLIYKNDG